MDPAPRPAENGSPATHRLPDTTSGPVLCNKQLGPHRHVCAIFNSSEEENDVLGPFLAEGHRQGHKIMAMVDPSTQDEMIALLTSHGIDVHGAIAEGKFDLTTWTETYFRQGSFAPESMVGLVEQTMTAARTAGHSAVWGIGNMSWLHLEPAASMRMVAYEVLLDQLKPRFQEDVWVCYYDATKFSGKVISDIIRAHPVVLLGKNVFENPFYTPPDQFLEELKAWVDKSNHPWS